MSKQKIQRLLSVVIIVLVAIFMVSSLYSYWHFRRYPDLYLVQSAPWYTNILVRGLFTIVLVTGCAIAKTIIKEDIKRSKKLLIASRIIAIALGIIVVASILLCL